MRGNRATSPDVALRAHPGYMLGLHKLKGNRKGQWAMTVNARWRICFEFRNGDAYEVEIVDYHKG
jgi:plasmid maintenance system killer protein